MATAQKSLKVPRTKPKDDGSKIFAATLHKVELPPQILARGFWLYVWKIVGPNDEQFCYVGMTGDVTGVAQSPFNRAGAHFGSNKTANAVRRHLSSRSVEPEKCKTFTFLVYGPVLPYWHSTPPHIDFHKSRKRIGALERKLWTAAMEANNKMLNERPRASAEFDEDLWKDIRAAFAPYLQNNPSRQS